MNANAGDKTGLPDQDAGTVSVREDFIEALQCPCCQLFFGLYLALPYDPSEPILMKPVPPEDVKEVHRQLLEHWRQQGSLVRDTGRLVTDASS